MSTHIASAQPKFDKALEHLKHELSQLRTGRATPAFVEDIQVMAYGQRQPVKALATITVPDPQTIVIQPWDKSVLGDIEKAVREHGTNLNPVNEGNIVRIPIPALTEETRKEIVKVLNQKLEQARIQVRAVRDDIKGDIIDAEKNKEISEDERYDALHKLDEKVKEVNDSIKVLGEEKEKAIMTM